MSDSGQGELIEAATRRDSRAQFDVGIRYIRGDGVQQDCGRAMEWLHKAADQGHARARFNVGAMYCTGTGVARDVTQAMKWYETALDGADPELLLNMEFLVEREHDTLQAWPFAMKCYKAAAHTGHDKAQYEVGRRLCTGEGVQENIEAGRHYVEAAARQGNAMALRVLAMHHLEGYCGEPNVPMAVHLVCMAVLSGAQAAEAEALDERLSPEQRAGIAQPISSMREQIKQEAANAPGVRASQH